MDVIKSIALFIEMRLVALPWPEVGRQYRWRGNCMIKEIKRVEDNIVYYGYVGYSEEGREDLHKWRHRVQEDIREGTFKWI